jgi:hypothetical protein
MSEITEFEQLMPLFSLLSFYSLEFSSDANVKPKLWLKWLSLKFGKTSYTFYHGEFLLIEDLYNHLLEWFDGVFDG